MRQCVFRGQPVQLLFCVYLTDYKKDWTVRRSRDIPDANLEIISKMMVLGILVAYSNRNYSIVLTLQPFVNVSGQEHLRNLSSIACKRRTGKYK